MTVKRFLVIIFVLIALLSFGIGVFLLMNISRQKSQDNFIKSFCNNGTPSGKCNRESNSESFYKFCNEQGVFVENCTQCGCFESIAQCNTNTKKCEIDISKRCPPYEIGCQINKEALYACGDTLKLKGNIKIGVVILSQFTEQQFPNSYLHLIKDQLNSNERNFFDKTEYIHNNLDYYKLSYINSWMKEQAKRIVGNDNFINLEFKFSTKEICYVSYDDYHQNGGTANNSKVSPTPAGNKLFSFITNNCMSGLNNVDALLVLGFDLDGAETLRGNLDFEQHRGGFKSIISINSKTIPFTYVDVTTLPPFCTKRDVAQYDKCQFPLGGSRSGQGCVELTCTKEECCYNSQLSGCEKGCVSPTGIRDVNSLAGHELLHVFGVADHGYNNVLGSDKLCVDIDTESIPLSLRNNNLPQCEGRTICSVCYSTGQLPLECAVITDKEARELGWHDNNNNGILEINEQN